MLGYTTARKPILAQGRQYVSARWLLDRDRLYYVRQEGDTRRLYTSRPDGSDEELWVASLPSEGNVFELKGRLFIYQENSGTPPDDKIHFVLDPDDRMPDGVITALSMIGS